jgi:hypothetical protein
MNGLAGADAALGMAVGARIALIALVLGPAAVLGFCARRLSVGAAARRVRRDPGPELAHALHERAAHSATADEPLARDRSPGLSRVDKDAS